MSVSSVSGTTNRITSTGGSNPVIDISTSYVGQVSIDTLGTISTGTWNGGVIGSIYGGTNQTSYTIGDTLYSSGTNTLSKLAGNFSTSTKYLSQIGDGVNSTAPAWNVISGGDVTGFALTRVNDTNVTLTLGGNASNALLRSTSITVDWIGTLAPSRGGTGVNNGSNTLTLGGSLATSGAYSSTFTMTGPTSLTFPTSGTLATISSVATSVTGTSNRITVSPTIGDCIVDISTSYVGQSSITTLGTITSGVWHSNIITETYGGTGKSTYTLGDTLYSSSTNVLSKLAGNITTTKQYLSQTGDGVNSAAPSWDTINVSDISGIMTLTQGGTNNSLTASNGGVVWSDASKLNILSGTATAKQVLLSGSTTTPAWSTATYPSTTTANQLLYSSATNTIAGTSNMTYDNTPSTGGVTISNTTTSTSNTTGSINTAGGIGISNTTDASSTTNGGTITTAGGAAIAKNLFVGTAVNTDTISKISTTGTIWSNATTANIGSSDTTGSTTVNVGTSTTSNVNTSLMTTWTGSTPLSSATFTSITYSPSLTLFVAVASNGGTGSQIYTSSDGISWAAQTSPNAQAWQSVFWAQDINLFVAVANNGLVATQIMTSSNGTSWSAATSSSATTWVSVCRGPRFVAVANVATTTCVMSSNIGTGVWTARTGIAATAGGWSSVCWSSVLKLFVAVSTSTSAAAGVMTSSDGITWAAATASSATSWSSVCWSQPLGLFVAVANNGSTACVMTSTSGTTGWTARTGVSGNWRSVCWSNLYNMFVAVGDSGTVMYSTNGSSWSSGTSPNSNNLSSVIFGVNNFVAVSTVSTTGNAIYTTTPTGYNTTINEGTSGLSTVNLNASTINLGTGLSTNVNLNGILTRTPVNLSYTLTTSQSTSSGVLTTVIFDTLVYSSGSGITYNPTTGFFTVTSTQYQVVLVSSTISFITSATGVRAAEISTPSSTEVFCQVTAPGMTAIATTMCVVGIIPLNSSKTFSIKASQNTGGALNVNGTGASFVYLALL